MKLPLIIAGSSGHALAIVDAFEQTSDYSIVGLLDDFKTAGDRVLEYPILGKIDQAADFVQQFPGAEFFAAIGDNWGRFNVVSRIKSGVANCKFASVAHPRAFVSPRCVLGHGVFIGPNASVCAAVELGSHSIVNTNSAVDHNSVIGDFASIGPGALLAGDVHVGDYSAVGMGAVIREKVRIGDHALVGAGSLVLDDIADEIVAIGSPAKNRKSRPKGQKYLR